MSNQVMSNAPASAEGLLTISGAFQRQGPMGESWRSWVQVKGRTRPFAGRVPATARGQLLTLEVQGERIVSAKRVFRDAEIALAFYGLIPGRVANSVSKIVRTLGDDTHKLITKQPGLLEGIKGVAPSGVKAMRKHAEQNLRLFQALHELCELQFPPELAAPLLKQEGAASAKWLSADPYALLKFGVPLEIMDHVAHQLGISLFDPRRIPALIVSSLHAAKTEYGHTCLPLDALASDLHEQHALIAEEIAAATTRAEEAGHLQVFAQHAYLPVQLRTERWIADDVARLLISPVPQVQPLQNPQLTAEQQSAVELACQSPICVLTGGPGTGKTTTLKAILQCFEAAGLWCELCAPTGKAASRMTQSTGRSATTIHKLLAYDGETFSSGRLPAQVYVVDEVSMASNELLGALLRSLAEGTRVVLVGDEDQLPPIDAGHPLAALIQTVPTARLTTTHRQAEHSPILTLAKMLIGGERPVNSGVPFRAAQTSADVVQIVAELWDDRTKPRPVVLTAGWAGPLGVHELNRAMQQAFNGDDPAEGIRVGDPVMMTRNNHASGLMNGMVGTISHFDEESERFAGKFDDELHLLAPVDLAHLTLAYAVTIHRSQGSEWDDVVVVLCEQHARLLSRQLAYTAVTRAKKRLIAAGHRSAWNDAATTLPPQRHSCLPQLLRE